MNMLTNRQLQILQVIVDDFVTSAQPVGSRQISKKEGITFSSATIRNEMADLEELGFLEKTHTSSGRVPSEKGYRYYVDNLLTPQAIAQEEIHRIQSIFTSKIMQSEQLIKQSAAILSELTTYTTVLLGPDMLQHKVKKFQIVPLAGQSAVAIIVMDNGHVENRIITIPDEISTADIEKMVNILNERIVGVPLYALHEKLQKEAMTVLKQHVKAADAFIYSLLNATKEQKEAKVYYGGKTNMLNQPEFHDIQKVRELMDLMETESQITPLLKTGNEGIEIRIGSENNHYAMENCSVITTSFQIGGELGSIAIIGPTRMDYQRVVTLMNFMRSGLTYALNEHE